jgi:Fur family ferric uptake transcriptional regulator
MTDNGDAMDTASPRSTRQRSAIRAAIEQAQRPLLPQEVLAAAQAEVPGLGIATVYRNLKALLDEGVVKLVTLPGENPRYETQGRGHHHHFQCTACERVFDVHACPGDLSRLAPVGFTVEDHELTLYGRCRECQPAARGRPGPRSVQPQ